MRQAPSSERSILAANAGLNILLGIVILLLPVTGGGWFGLPDATPFLFSSVLGAVLVAVGLALLVQRAGGSGLGLGGAAVLGLLGAGAAFAWLGLGGSAIPAPGRWVVAAAALLAIALAGLSMTSRDHGDLGAPAASEAVELRPIGVIRTPFRTPGDAPIQPSRSGGAEGTVELQERYRDGLSDLEGFSHVVLLYHFDRSRGFELRVVPFLDSHPRGVFATRSPRRPNPIGLSVVRLLEVKGSTLRVADVDMLDRTPLLDVKPYVPEFDHRPEIRVGWLEAVISKGRTPPRGGIS